MHGYIKGVLGSVKGAFGHHESTLGSVERCARVYIEVGGDTEEAGVRTTRSLSPLGVVTPARNRYKPTYDPERLQIT